MVSDDEADQSASADAFQLLRLITAKRLRRGRLTVIDATNVQPTARKSLLALASAELGVRDGDRAESPLSDLPGSQPGSRRTGR